MRQQDRPAPSDPAAAGPDAEARSRRRDTRDRMLSAARALFAERGYPAVTVEDIALRAGVSRMTFYRHFAGKTDLTAALFDLAARAAMPRLAGIGEAAFRDRNTVEAWLAALFAADGADRALLRVFLQARPEDGFAERAHDLIGELIRALGARIPAFAADPARPGQRRRWVRAWLLLFEILEQSSHAALGRGVASADELVAILAGRFLRFVRDGDPGPGAAPAREGERSC